MKTRVSWTQQGKHHAIWILYLKQGCGQRQTPDEDFLWLGSHCHALLYSCRSPLRDRADYSWTYWQNKQAKPLGECTELLRINIWNTYLNTYNIAEVTKRIIFHLIINSCTKSKVENVWHCNHFSIYELYLITSPKQN